MVKNKTISLKKLLQTIVLFVFATTWFNSANASFLCVCSDGHTTIESIYSSDCHQDEFQDHHNDGFQLKQQHNCKDTLLLSNSPNSTSNALKNLEMPNISSTTNFMQPVIISINQSQVYLPTPYIQTDNKPRIFTDSIRLII